MEFIEKGIGNFFDKEEYEYLHEYCGATYEEYLDWKFYVFNSNLEHDFMKLDMEAAVIPKSNQEKEPEDFTLE